MIRYIGIAAYSGEPDEHHLDKVRRLIESISSKGDDIVLVLGGYWGLMKYIVDYALENKLKVILIPPVEKEDYSFPDKCIVIKSGMSYRLRSILLVRTSDALIAAGGGAGTIHEIVTASLEGKNIYVLRETGLPSDNIEKLGEYIDQRKLSIIKYYTSPEELVEDLFRDLSC